MFQNWHVIARAWYFACPSRDVPPGSAKSLNICGQHVVIFRSEDGSSLHSMDGFCPHMGTDLGIGSVHGDRLACFFHHWEFGSDGKCQHVPCGEAAPDHARLKVYAVAERFGAIWIFPDTEADFFPPAWDEFASDNDQVLVSFEKAYLRSCHHHVTMINGIDAQHLRTVHGFDIAMELSVEDNTGEGQAGTLDFTLSGELPGTRRRDRLIRKLAGDHYGYSMRYSAGSIGLLTILQGVRLFRRWKMPTLHMIFAYRPLAFGSTLVQAIYVTPKRAGLFGPLIERSLIWLTRCAFHILQDEDGKVYDNMRFNPNALIEIDRPVKQFIAAINRLRSSDWSGAWRQTNPEK